MSKNVYVFAVVREELGKALTDLARSTSRGLSADASPVVVPSLIESRIQRELTLDEGALNIAFYRSIMDGLNLTHTVLADWVSASRPRVSHLWHRFVRRNLLIANWRSKPLRGLLPAPGPREMRNLAQGAGEYASRAFLVALYDAIRFLAAARGTLIVTARCVGPTLDDSEYARS